MCGLLLGAERCGTDQAARVCASECPRSRQASQLCSGCWRSQVSRVRRHSCMLSGDALRRLSTTTTIRRTSRCRGRCCPC